MAGYNIRDVAHHRKVQMLAARIHLDQNGWADIASHLIARSNEATDHRARSRLRHDVMHARERATRYRARYCERQRKR